MESDTGLFEAAREHLARQLRRAEEDQALHRQGLDDADGRVARLRGALAGWDGARSDLVPCADPAPPSDRGLAIARLPRGPAKGTRGREALDLLGGQPSRHWKAGEAAEALGATRHAMRNVLEDLVGKGLAERTPDATYRIAAGAGKGRGGDMTMERVLGVLRGNTQITWWRASQLAERLGGADPDLVREHLRQLAADGKLEKNDDRRYRLPLQARAEEPDV